jgi:hypothetical protein
MHRMRSIPEGMAKKGKGQATGLWVRTPPGRSGRRRKWRKCVSA